MSRWKKRIDQIKQKVPINDLLIGYGYKVHGGGEGQEQQFPCDLHGSGRDNKPSARVYPASNSWYCFACDATRDAIGTVQAKQGLDFKDAVSFLEKKFKLTDIPWDDDDAARRAEVQKPSLTSVIHSSFHKNRTFADALKMTHSTLGWVTVDREVPMDTVLGFWEASDAVAWMVEQQQITEERGLQALAKLSDRIDAILTGPPE